jgi:hypothetical protein
LHQADLDFFSELFQIKYRLFDEFHCLSYWLEADGEQE